MADIELLPLARMNWPYSVISATLATPPGSPSSGDPYIVAASPTGAWSGHANAIARWSGSVWEFQTPGLGRSVYVEAISFTLRWDGSNWVNPNTTGAGSLTIATPPGLRGGVPGALDDEFDSTTLNAAWVFRDLTTGPTNRTPVVGAFNENTNMTGATTVPNVSLHTQGRRSWMNVQTTNTGTAGYAIYKPFTWAAGQVYYTRCARMSLKTGTTATTGTYALSMWANSGGLPDQNNRAFVMWDLLNLTCRWGTVVAGSSTNVAFNMSNGMGMPEYAAISNPAGVLGGSANWFGEFFEDGGRRMLPAAPGAAAFTFTPAYIGWQYSNDLANPSTMSADFIRENTGHPLLHL